MKKIMAGLLGFALGLYFSGSLRVWGDAAAVTPTHQIIINEVMAGSEVNPDKDAWFELYNPGTEEILLGGWQVRGVTKGGKWINLVDEDYRAIQPHAYFLVSHYTNSSSSALEVKPQVNKTSILFPAEPIAIELKDSKGALVDQVRIERASGETDYHSYERLDPMGDGLAAASWGRASTSVNLKTSLSRTFATPFALNSVSTPPPPLPPPPPEPGPPTPKILINEVLPNPKIRDNQNEFVELLNAGTAAVDLRGWELDDENDSDNKSYFFIDQARDYLLQPGAMMVLYSAETQVSLNNLGDGVQFFDPEGNLADSYFFAPDLVGRSWGRNPEKTDEWLSFNHPTPGAPNVEVNHPPVASARLQQDSRYLTVNLTGEDSADPDGDALSFLWTLEPGATDTRKNPTGYTYAIPGPKTITLAVTDEFGLSATASVDFLATVLPGSSKHTQQSYPDAELIRAFMPNPTGKDAVGEWIELFNSTGETLNLSGWFLDDGAGASKPFPIPNDTYLEPGASMILKGIGLSLKNSQDVVRLLDPNHDVKQTVAYSGAKENTAYQSAGSVASESAPVVPKTPPLYSTGSVKIESALPNPEHADEGHELLTLLNTLAAPVDLKGWSLLDGKGDTHVFEPFVLSAGQSHTFEQSAFQLHLKNENGQLALLDPTGFEVDRLEWANAQSGQWIFKLDNLSDGVSATVRRVVDGDTIEIEFLGNTFKVRLIGVNTPETVHPYKSVEFYGKEASDYLKKRLTGAEVALAFEPEKQDKYSRLLAYVTLDGVLINAELVQKGYGTAYTRFPFKYSADFVAYQAEAKAAGYGLWHNPVVARMAESGDLEPSEDIPAPAEPSPTEAQKPETPVVTLLLENCSAVGLVIDAIFPAPRKGEGGEFIRLKNTGLATACLAGWSLDDTPGKGSKPFILASGGIDPGAMRTFRSAETSLQLNNQNDCATLLDPAGNMADQICYGKTHAGELFTHSGGDWQPKRRVVKRVVAKPLVPTMYQVGTTAEKSLSASGEQLHPPTARLPDGQEQTGENSMVMSSVLLKPKAVMSSLDVAMAQDLVALSQLPAPAVLAAVPSAPLASPVSPTSNSPSSLPIAFSTGIAFLVLVVLRKLFF